MPQNPSSVESEQALLGIFIMFPETLATAFDRGLTAGDFYNAANRRIYQALTEMDQQKIPVEPASLITKLDDMKALNAVGGAAYINQLTDSAFSAEGAEHYIATLRDKALLRALIQAGEEIKNAASDGTGAVVDILADAENKVLAVTRNLQTSDFTTSRQAMEDVKNQYSQLRENKGMTGVKSGFAYLDRITNGFQPGDLIILAARPSVGKTALALNIAANAAVRDHRSVAFFSLEMPVLALGMRMVSCQGRIDNNTLRTGRSLDNDQWARFVHATDELSAAHIYLDDSPSVKVNEIFAKCRKLKAEDSLDLIIVDYLQLIAPSTTRQADNRQQEVSEISRGLKALAREMNVPVIALSQLSRSVEQRGGDKRPMLSDLRESGSIEQDADVVLFLYNPSSGSGQGEDGEEAAPQPAGDAVRQINVIVGKHRNGQTGEFPLMFQPNINAFFDKEKDEA